MEDEMGRACRTYGKETEIMQEFGGKTRKKASL
jgi:hypothetical protein